MKIAIIGAGAMGSLFGALLSEMENDVWLYDVWLEHVQAISERGLSVEREGKSRVVKLKATNDPAQIGETQLVIVFVKSTQTEPAAETARELIRSGGSVMTLQNGMGNADIISQFIKPDRILAGTTSHGATVLGPGSIRHAGVGPTTIGVWKQTNEGLENARKTADFFNQAGIETEAVDDVHGVVWNKLLINIGINAITALTGIKNGQLIDLESTREISRAAVQEAISVAQASGIRVNTAAAENVFKVAQATAVNRSSMGQDVDSRRQTEIGAINGYIVREAKKLGISAPVNQTLAALVETLQYHYR